jgi:hypothetical protein
MTPWKHWTLLTLALGAGCNLEPGKSGDDGGEDQDDGGGIHLDAEPACAHDVSGWYVTPSSVVAQATDDGLVDYPTGAPLLDGVTGSFDASAGTLVYTQEYADGHRWVARTFEGSGTYEANGDLLVEGTLAHVDRLGAEYRYRHTISQTGCRITNSYQPEDEDSAYSDYERTTRIVDADTVEGRIVAKWTGLDWEEEYTSRSDFTTTYTTTVDHDLYVISGTYNADGTHDREVIYLAENSRQESVYAYAPDGDHTREMLGYSIWDDELVQEFSTSMTYEGGGSGTYRYVDGQGEWVTCDYTRDDNDDPDCSYAYDCDNGEEFGGEC